MSAHMNQITDYPKNARVETITEVFCHVGNIPIGTRGTVTGHCEDGRAWVFFDGFEAGHTFHEPESSIRLIRIPSNESPAPRAGEGEQSKLFSRYTFAVVTGRYKILDNRSDGPVRITQIATADGEDEARLIIQALNQHATLVAERDRLLEAIRDIAIRSLCYCEEKYDHEDQARLNLEALITTIEQEGKP